MHKINKEIIEHAEAIAKILREELNPHVRVEIESYGVKAVSDDWFQPIKEEPGGSSKISSGIYAYSEDYVHKMRKAQKQESEVQVIEFNSVEKYRETVRRNREANRTTDETVGILNENDYTGLIVESNEG
ncbi:hypothetical protein GQR36_20215 [Enterococcus termitis]